MDDYLGSGTCGEVKRIYSSRLRQVIAVKSVRLPSKRGTKEEALIMREAKIHRHLNHPNILPCFHYDVRTTSASGDKAEGARILSLALELMTGDVHDLVVSGGAAATSERLLVAEALLRQMLQALDHLATTARLVHRDVKPANMLYRRLDLDDDDESASFVFKLADFGVAKPWSENDATSCPTSSSSPSSSSSSSLATTTTTTPSSPSSSRSFYSSCTTTSSSPDAARTPILGTPRYWAPECRRRLDLPRSSPQQGPPADVWALLVSVLWVAQPESVFGSGDGWSLADDAEDGAGDGGGGGGADNDGRHIHAVVTVVEALVARPEFRHLSGMAAREPGLRATAGEMLERLGGGGGGGGGGDGGERMEVETWEVGPDGIEQEEEEVVVVEEMEWERGVVGG
ncbi:hypothetical protein SLS58_002841 [Diplodia intermedia]|uniref:Protein kinase domain-containing protein n=1 Tax=Diplodia intermedia TaxID=856260 RepID=A0ABR3TYN7_9PEZI